MGGQGEREFRRSTEAKLTAAEWFLLSYTVQKGYKSDRAAAEACSMDRETAKRAREHLQALKLWPESEDSKAE